MLESTRRELMNEVLLKIWREISCAKSEMGLHSFDRKRPLWRVIEDIERKIELLAEATGYEFYKPSQELQIKEKKYNVGKAR